MDLREEGQLVVFFLLGGGLLCAAQALISLLLRIDRACIASTAANILHLNDSHVVVVILEEFLVVARAARDVPTHVPISTIFLDSINDCVDGIDFILAAFLGPDILHSVFTGTCYVALRRLTAHLVGGGRIRVLLRLLRGCSGCIEAAMNLNLTFHSLEDGMARALLRAVLGTTHWLCGGYGPVGSATVLRDGRRLISALRARLSHDVTSSSPVTILRDNWSTHADLRSTSDDRTGGCEALSGAHLVSSRVNVLFLNDCGLITSACVGLLRANSAAWVRAQVLDLTDVTATIARSLSFHIVEDDALDVIDLVGVCCVGGHSLRHSSLDEGMLRDEEATACFLIDEGLGELSITVLVGHLPFNSSPTASLPTDYIVTCRIHNHLMNFIDGVCRSGRLCSLRRGLVETSCMPRGPLGIDSVLGRD